MQHCGEKKRAVKNLLEKEGWWVEMTLTPPCLVGLYVVHYAFLIYLFLLKCKPWCLLFIYIFLKKLYWLKIQLQKRILILYYSKHFMKKEDLIYLILVYTLNNFIFRYEFALFHLECFCFNLNMRLSLIFGKILLVIWILKE